MSFIDEQLFKFKKELEDAIILGGKDGKDSMIRSSYLINLIHDAVKFELVRHDINSNNIYPKLGETKPEIKLAGFLKQKNQDVCVLPNNIIPKKSIIDWGPMAFQKKIDQYGFDFTNNALVINVRSQMSSLNKNSDTLFERTFAEALNLHMRYPNIVLGEVYLIPLYEYDDEAVKEHRVLYKSNPTNIAKYISFFDSINNRKVGESPYMYEQCALLIVDFSQKQPRLFKNNQELIEEGVLSSDFEIEYATLNFETFTEEILKKYHERFDINNLR